jgi:hypothetical protein
MTEAEAPLLAALEELLELAGTHQHSVTTDGVLAVSQAWLTRACDNVRGALMMHRERLDEGAAPLVRSAIEHAIGIVWLERTGIDGLASLAKGRQKWLDDVLAARALADEREKRPGRTDWPADMTAALTRLRGEDVPPNPTNRDLNHFPRFETAAAFDLYVAWLSETAASHATAVSARAYQTYTVDDGRFVLHPIALPQAGYSLLVRCTNALVVGSRAMALLLESPTWAAAIDRQDLEAGAAHRAAESARLDAAMSASWTARFDV